MRLLYVQDLAHDDPPGLNFLLQLDSPATTAAILSSIWLQPSS